MLKKLLKEKKFERDSEAISLMQGVPDGFFRCNICRKVLPTTKFGSTVWAGKGVGYLCKNCFGVGESKPKIPERLLPKEGEKPKSVKRY
ncbi:hypothetical protein HZC32_01535, partial [Candidatus Woesearchaeota archaeon]|nr:hypothetical protein [Candidatus Woesearchaeota archaeon]